MVSQFLPVLLPTPGCVAAAGPTNFDGNSALAKLRVDLNLYSLIKSEKLILIFALGLAGSKDLVSVDRRTSFIREILQRAIQVHLIAFGSNKMCAGQRPLSVGTRASDPRCTAV